jgi:CheY-like chemotaxis protein
MAGDRRRVLVVDDDFESQTGLRELFTVWGYDVDVAEDGKRALDLARRRRPDVVVMDLGLPQGDALHVIQLLSADGVRVIAFSGWGQAEVAARAAGAEAFVLKPDLERLERVLAGSEHRGTEPTDSARVPRR